MALLHELHDQGSTIVMVTHSRDDAAHAARIIALRDGQVVADEPGAERAGQVESGTSVKRGGR